MKFQYVEKDFCGNTNKSNECDEIPMRGNETLWKHNKPN